MKPTHNIPVMLAATVLAAGCSQLPDRIESLEQARAAVQTIEQDPLARDVSQTRYEQARAALDRAEAAYEDGDDLDVIENASYVALRNAQIVQEQADERRAREELDRGEADRNRVLLQAREREAERATAIAEERSQALEQRERELEQQARLVEAAEARARDLAAETQTLQQQTEQLQQQLADLEAEQTARGWVMTLSDVLFEHDGDRLSPGAATTIERLASFLDEHPEHNIVIEGHTDSTGAAAYNADLSRRRADAVRTALSDRGIASNRVEIRALGEEFPVATNDTDAGRQLNRRVEIVLSDDAGRFQGEQRTASAEPTEQED